SFRLQPSDHTFYQCDQRPYFCQFRRQSLALDTHNSEMLVYVNHSPLRLSGSRTHIHTTRAHASVCLSHSQTELSAFRTSAPQAQVSFPCYTTKNDDITPAPPPMNVPSPAGVFPK